jgi:hypothetical protein
MKKTYLAIFVLFLSSNMAHATLSVGLAKKYARAVYDVSLNGGASTSHDLNAQLPAGAVITDFYVYINTAFTDSGTGSLAIQCSGTRDLLDWQDITAASVNYFYGSRRAQNTFNGSSTTMVPESTSAVAVGIGSVPSPCNVTAVVRSSSGYVPLTAGKLTAVIEYFQP